MKILTPGVSLDDFFAQARKAPQCVLMLDYDGTLAPFRIDRENAYPYPGVSEQLTGLCQASHTRLIIVSGRAVSDLMPLLGLESFPEIWGSHGAERYLPGRGIQPAKLPARTEKGLAEVEKWVAVNEFGEVTERKPAGIAFHYRGLGRDDQRRIERAVKSQWLMRIHDYGLEMQEFDGGIELRAAGISKGDAVRAALESSEAAAAAYLGDDVTDEDAFNALEGKGLRVLVREQLRDTAADLHLIPPDELLDFLDRWLAIEG